MSVTIKLITPIILMLLISLNLTGCATSTATLPSEEPAMHSVKEMDEDVRIAYLGNDPMLSYNKSMYRFNYNFDQYVFLPVVNSYEYITPTPVQTGVSNFFNNIAEIRTLYNSLFQLKGAKALTTTGRFITNSTIGIAGLFDPATALGMKRQDEDFGQTLGYWGVPPGPYVVLPLLGPGTARSSAGFLVDSGVHYAISTAIDLPGKIDNGKTIQAGVTALKVIDNRHQQSFRYFDSGYPFEYELVRFLYREKRELAVMK